MTVFVDAHTHQTKTEQGVVKVTNVDITGELQYADFYCLGMHPWWVEQWQSDYLKKMQTHIEQPDCIGIGEIGLDRMHRESWVLQLKVLEEILHWAIQFPQYPLIIHCVKASEDLFSMLKNFPIKNTLLFHDFNGAPEQFQRWLDHYSCCFSFGAKLQQPTSKAWQALSGLPLEVILAETDDGDGPIDNVYQQLAAIKNIEIEDLKTQLFKNALRVFGDPLQLKS